MKEKGSKVYNGNLKVEGCESNYYIQKLLVFKYLYLCLSMFKSISNKDELSNWFKLTD